MPNFEFDLNVKCSYLIVETFPDYSAKYEFRVTIETQNNKFSDVPVAELIVHPEITGKDVNPIEKVQLYSNITLAIELITKRFEQGHGYDDAKRLKKFLLFKASIIKKAIETSVNSAIKDRTKAYLSEVAKWFL